MAHYKNNGSQVSKRTNVANQRSQKKKKKLSYSQIVVFILMVIWSIASVLSIFNFVSILSDKDIKTAKADSVDTNYVFYGANYFIVTTSWNNNGTVYYDGGAHSLSVDTSILRISNSDTHGTNRNAYIPCISFTAFWVSNQNKLVPYHIARDNVTYLDLNYYTYDNYDYIILPYVDSRGTYYDEFWLGYPQVQGNEYTGRYGHIIVECSPNFNCNVYSVNYVGTLTYEYLDVPIQTSHGATYYLVDTVNTVTYTDTDGNICTVTYLSTYSFRYYDRYTRGYVSWDNRTYYMVDTISDSEQYRLGYDSGYSNGKDDYLNSGYQDGYNAGRVNGYNQGKQEGIASANEYSWLGLLGAVVDVPLQALSGLLGFEIFGINLLSLASGLFTLCIILFLLRIVFGGGTRG